jgi:hypothetical protein
VAATPSCAKPHTVHHAFEQCHVAPCADFAAGEFDFKRALVAHTTTFEIPKALINIRLFLMDAIRNAAFTLSMACAKL